MFCTALVRFRKGLGLTQRALGQAVGVSASAVGMYEQGRRLPGRRTAALLTDFFGRQGLWLPPPPQSPERPLTLSALLRRGP